ncbi:hypothetical protein Hoch_1111 [Haliangium ochraceum DSM 14365]|uniref:Uncharacterized protein n=1 Tax=Haliangium ochraceum (strain DSM 14365 / JCM 11303 / SMP-2) TaxID=502025 RepID=D0LRZ8_HALO1|nr:hypothetical protein Hoch_1111 [Haliangium ochraceum DSM 14365]
MLRLPETLLALALPLLMAPDCVSYGNGEGRPNPIDPTDCVANLQECLSSDLFWEPGSVPGTSVCVDCRDRCRSLGVWPHRTTYGKDCRWWLYQIVFAGTAADECVDAGAHVDAGALP